MKLELWRRGGFRDGIKVVKCSGGSSGGYRKRQEEAVMLEYCLRHGQEKAAINYIVSIFGIVIEISLLGGN